MLKLKNLAIAVCVLLFLASLNFVRAAGLHAQTCDPSYPTVCIAPAPPDLDCGDIEHRNFKVEGDDPHNFDGDQDGIGCEA